MRQSARALPERFHTPKQQHTGPTCSVIGGAHRPGMHVDGAAGGQVRGRRVELCRAVRLVCIVHARVDCRRVPIRPCGTADSKAPSESALRGGRQLGPPAVLLSKEIPAGTSASLCSTVLSLHKLVDHLRHRPWLSAGGGCLAPAGRGAPLRRRLLLLLPWPSHGDP